jgi:hypothetical protein
MVSPRNSEARQLSPRLFPFVPNDKETIAFAKSPDQENLLLSPPLGEKASQLGMYMGLGIDANVYRCVHDLVLPSQGAPPKLTTSSCRFTGSATWG